MTFKFPTAYTIPFLFIIALVACWHLDCARRTNTIVFENVVARKQKYLSLVLTSSGIRTLRVFVWCFSLRRIAGFLIHPDAYEAAAIDVALFCSEKKNFFFKLVGGPFLGVVTKTGAMITGVSRPMGEAWKVWVKWMEYRSWCAILRLGVSTYGMAEESWAFYALGWFQWW